MFEVAKHPQIKIKLFQYDLIACENKQDFLNDCFSYTGKILVGRHIIKDDLVKTNHLIFRFGKPWLYKKLFVFTFEDGEIIHKEDFSKLALEMRTKVKRRKEELSVIEEYVVQHDMRHWWKNYMYEKE